MIEEEIEQIIEQAEKKLSLQFKRIDDIALFNQEKVLNAFQELNVSQRHMFGSTGYGYGDDGRECLSKLFSIVFGGENSIVSPLITCGSHALATTLYGLLRPNDRIVSIAGKPYDTLDDTIFGKKDKDIGSLKDFGVNYDQIDLVDGTLDKNKIKAYLSSKKPKVVFLQRSRGYSWRKPISINEIREVSEMIKIFSPLSFFVVDNCYGEFVDKIEPCQVGADICVGSLIKNPGGGMAPTGAYIVGKANAIDLISSRFTSPSLGLEVGSYEQGYRCFFEGLFMAPHIVANSVKGAYLLGEVMNYFGFEVLPKSEENAGDIIKSIKFDTADELISFVQEIQKCSPIDSNAVPMPWDMPGYDSQVIMAAGTFVGGSSIELSCDSPIRKPYIAYMQGGLTYEHVKIATKQIAKIFLEKKERQLNLSYNTNNFAKN